MGKSSKDRRDVYYRLAKEDGYRARSAYKLRQIDDHFKILQGIARAVDLCAAPGSWTQVLSERLQSNAAVNKSEVKIVAVDLQIMEPIPGVTHIQGDITKMETAQAVIDHFQGKSAELVLCDGSPDTTKLHDMDGYIQHQLVLAAFTITTHVLAPGGAFLAKLFRTKNVESVLSLLQGFFGKVTVAKPSSCRNSSIESFVFCKDFRPPENLPEIGKPLLLTSVVPTISTVAFVALKGNKAYDPDTSYPLKLRDDRDYHYVSPTNMPIAPPYADATAVQQNRHLSYTMIVKD